MRLIRGIAATLAVTGLLTLWINACGGNRPPVTKVTPPPAPVAEVPESSGFVEPKWNEPTKDANCVTHDGLPDVACTPGAIVAANTVDVVCDDKNFKTASVRDSKSAPAQKQQVYPMYNIPAPQNNAGRNQVCEIDHLVPIELGGDDTIPNLWPECSPGYQLWEGFGFRDKDNFENWLWNQVCVQKTLSLKTAQIETCVAGHLRMRSLPFRTGTG
jgi:hypothetical protein